MVLPILELAENDMLIDTDLKKKENKINKNYCKFDFIYLIINLIF